MIQEAECLKIIDEVLSKLDLGDFEIRVNYICNYICHYRFLIFKAKSSSTPRRNFCGKWN